MHRAHICIRILENVVALNLSRIRGRTQKEEQKEGGFLAT